MGYLKNLISQIKEVDSFSRLAFLFLFLFPLMINPWGNDIHELPKAVFLKFSLLFFCFLLLLSNQKIFKFKIPSLFLPFFFFLLALSFTSFFSPNLREAFFGESLRRFGVSYFWWCFLLFLLISNLSERGKELSKSALLFSSFLISLYAITQSLGFDFLPPSKNWEAGRAFATFGNPLYLASFLLLSIPLFWELWEKKPSFRLISGLAITFLSAALVLSYSRGAIIVLFTTSLIYLYIKRRISWKNKIGVLIVVVGLFLAFILLQTVGLKPLKRFASPISLGKGALPRLSFWKLALKGISQSPLAGHGWGSFLNYFRKNSSLLVKEEGISEVADKVHNDYLEFGFSGGLFSFLFFLWLFLFFFLKRGWEKSRDLPLRLGAFAYLLFHFSTFSTVSTFPIFVSFLALSTHDGWEVEFRILRNAFNLILVAFIFIFAYLVFVNSKALIGDTFKEGGMEAFEEGRWTESLPFFGKAVSYEPSDKWNWLYLGKSYFSGGRNQRREDLLEGAVKSYQEALRLDPYFFEAHLDLGSTYLFWGEAFQKRDLIEKAKNSLMSAVYVFPASSVGYYELGLCYIALGDKERAIKSWQTSVRNNPSFPDPLFSLGVVYESQGEFEKAEEYFLRAEKVAKDKEAVDLIKRSLKELKEKK